MSAATQSDPVATGHAPLVFIVDDEPVAAEVVAELLQLEGYRTQVFHDALAAFEAVRGAAAKPDLLLADFKMPGMNGMQLLAHAKAEVHGLQTILLSGMANDLPADEPRFRPDQFVAKPVRLATLLSSVRRALA
jgi:CheY-like chemotaxis protein